MPFEASDRSARLPLAQIKIHESDFPLAWASNNLYNSLMLFYIIFQYVVTIKINDYSVKLRDWSMEHFRVHNRRSPAEVSAVIHDLYMYLKFALYYPYMGKIVTYSKRDMHDVMAYHEY